MAEWLENEIGSRKSEEIWSKQYQFENTDHLFARQYLQPSYPIETSLWGVSYPEAASNTKLLPITPLMLALSNKQYHVVDWLINEKKVKLPTVLFNNQLKFDSMDYQFARQYVGNDY